MTLIPTKFTVFIAAVALALGASAQMKLSPGAVLRLQKYHTDVALSRGADADAVVLATFEVTSAEALDSICALGASVVNRFGDFAIVNLPLAVAERAAAFKSVRGVEFGTEARPMLDNARRYTNVDAVHSGRDIRMPYTGKDVVVGIIDSGFDPNHPAFLDADGNSRVSKLFYTANGISRVYSGDEVADFETDNDEGTHGTHVAGIAAGSRIANATVPIFSAPNEEGKVSIESIGDGKLPYYGIAPDAEIVLACGDLQLSTVLDNAEKIIDYAESVGKPAVINISLGTNSGPHDGSTTFNRGLAELGKRAVFAVSAGNEGDSNIGIDYIAKEKSGTFYTLFDLSGYTQAKPCRTVLVDLVGLQCTRMTGALIGVDKTTGTTLFTINFDPALQGVDSDLGGYYPFESADMTKIRKYFNVDEAGAIIGRVTDDNSYRGLLAMSNVSPLSSNKSVSLGIRVTSVGEPGRHITAFTLPESPFTSGGVKDYLNGTPDMSISDMATGENIISVGSYNSRYIWPCLDKFFHGYDEKVFPLKEPSYFSSYGILPDGRRLPHISGPGALVVSSISRYWKGTKDSPRPKDGDIAAEVASPDGDSPKGQYWQMMGTSMSSPAVAGIVALWLEADPELTVADVIDIMQKTAIKDDHYSEGNNAVREGAGRIDAYGGIKEVLARRYGTGIADVGADNDGDNGVMFDITEGSVSAFIAGASSATITITTIAGATAGSASSTGSEVSASTESLTPGIYIITATDGRRRASRKLAVK